MDKLGRLQKDPKYRRVAPKWIQIQWIRQTFPKFLIENSGNEVGNIYNKFGSDLNKSDLNKSAEHVSGGFS